MICVVVLVVVRVCRCDIVQVCVVCYGFGSPVLLVFPRLDSRYCNVLGKKCYRWSYYVCTD